MGQHQIVAEPSRLPGMRPDRRRQRGGQMDPPQVALLTLLAEERS
jgi:hypothetical protein